MFAKAPHSVSSSARKMAVLVFLIGIIHLINKATLSSFQSPLSHAFAVQYASTHSHEVPSEGSDEKLAYVTWYSSTVDSSEDLEHDMYFIATRMLIYQILHDPRTKTRRNIPFVVLVTPDVSSSRRNRFLADGATVLPVDWLAPTKDWIKPRESRWATVMSKLRIYELTQFSRILLLDSDTVLQSSLDGVFDDPAAQLQATNTAVIPRDDEAPLPDAYVMASLASNKSPAHSFPSTDEDWADPDYFCAGFFLIRPSLQMFEHMVSVLNIPDRFNSGLPEQNLLNYVFRRDGPVPWRTLQRHWNTRETNKWDLEAGAVSAHMKWWVEGMSGHQEVWDFGQAVRWRMEGFWEGVMEKEAKLFS